MPRNDLKAYTSVIARIPQDLADQVKQYASQHRCSVSELIREGLEMRLDADVPGRSRDSSSDAGSEVFHGVLQVLNTMAPRLQAVLRETITEVLHEGIPRNASTQQHNRKGYTSVIPSEIPVSPPTRQGMTKVVHTDTQEQTSADKVLPKDTADAFDPTRFVEGALCPQGHDDTGTGQSLRYLRGDHDCVTCRRERNERYNEQKRETRRQKAAQPQKG